MCLASNVPLEACPFLPLHICHQFPFENTHFDTQIFGHFLYLQVEKGKKMPNRWLKDGYKMAKK